MITLHINFLTSYSVFIYAIFNALPLSLWVYTLYLKCFTSILLHIYPWIYEVLRLSLSPLIRCLYTVLLLSHHPYTSCFVSFVTLHHFPSTVSLRPMAAATKRKSMTMETDFIVWMIKKKDKKSKIYRLKGVFVGYCVMGITFNFESHNYFVTLIDDQCSRNSQNRQMTRPSKKPEGLSSWRAA